jgi:FKBP-type peptidyl-prolyl cis-trans isomerase
VRLVSILLVAGMAVSLSACTAPSHTAAPNCAATKSGTTSDGVKVTGEFGSKPTVKIDAPLSVKSTERTVVIAGKGKLAQTGDEVLVNFTILNGTSGAVLSTSDYTAGTEQSFVVDQKLYLVGLIKTIHCAAIGGRVVGVIPPADAWHEAGSTELGVAPGESIVFVADIVNILSTKANGKAQPAEPGFPTVVLAKDGTPTVTIPATAPPTKTAVAVLKKGDGAIVAAGDSIRIQYQGINWTSGKVFDQTWGKSAPYVSTTDAFIPGFSASLVGQTINSQILIVIPPADGYGAGGGPEGSGIAGTDTLVFVVDILPTK